MSNPERLRPGETRQTLTETRREDLRAIGAVAPRPGQAPQKAAHFVNRMVSR